MNIWEAMQQKLVNIYQFLYHVTPVVIYQGKSWSDWTLFWVSSFLVFLYKCFFPKIFESCLWFLNYFTFSSKKMAPEQKMLVIWSQDCWGQKSLFFSFIISQILNPCRNPDFTKFLPVMHFHTIQEHPLQI